MAITVGVDTYISLADANTHFTGRPYAAEWAAASDAAKEAALREATINLEFLEYVGDRYDTTTPQALKWPRDNLPLIDGVDYSGSTIPALIAKACAEEALAVLKADPTTTVSSDKYKRVALPGGLEAEYRDIVRDRTRIFVSGYLQGFLTTQTASGQAVMSHG